ncbi:MAG TPA: HEAT repeat domain-containing protein, partial [Polyangiaceae bacterium]
MTIRDLEQALGSDDPEERRRATARLSDHPASLGVPLLIAALGDDDWRVRKEAAAVAKSMAPAPELLKELVEALALGDNVGLHNAAVEALAGHGEQAVATLAQAIDRLDVDARKLAADALGRCGLASALGPLRVLAEDDDPNVRAAGIEGIATLGLTCPDECVPALEHYLGQPDRFEKLVALDGLNRLGVTVAWSRLKPLLSDPVLEQSVIRAAGKTGAAEACEHLCRALSRSRAGAFRAALESFAEFLQSGAMALELGKKTLPRFAAECEPKLLDTLASDDVLLRRVALMVSPALASEPIVQRVVAAISDDSLAPLAAAALETAGSAAIGPLSRAAEHGDELTRARAVSLLAAHTTGHDDVAARAIRRALSDSSEAVRVEAVRALSTANPEAALPELVRRLESAHGPKERNAISAALPLLAEQYPVAARELARAATPQSPSALAACAILYALKRDGEDALEDIAFLSAALSNEDPTVRRAALGALSVLGGSESLEPVAFALTDEELEVRTAAVRALGRIRSRDDDAPGVELLLELVEQHSSPPLLPAAVRALGETRDRRALDALCKLVVGSDASTAVAAVEALGRFDGERVLDSLLEATRHASPEVVKASLLLLGDRRDARVAAHVGACLDHEAWDVRRLAADLLGRLGEHSQDLLR